MRILIVSQYFWPEIFVINELARTLRDQGHSVVVATGKPNYPDGRVFDGYRSEGTQRESFASDIEVLRVPLRPRRDGSAWSLLLNYASFAFSGMRHFPSLLAGRDFDAILVFAVSPITAALPAIALKWTTKAHLAIWVQDLWPESLAATGHVQNRLLLATVGLMVRAIYRGADTLLVQSRAFVDPVARYARRDKIVYYPNSIRLATGDDASSTDLPSQLSSALASHFCVVFTGNIGSVQAVPTVVEAASRLLDLPEVKLVLIGGGSMAGWAKARQKELGLSNLMLVERLPPTAMPAVYRQSAALLVTLKDDEVLAHTVPSKVQGYLAAGRPIIAALRGEGARVVMESGAGMTCAPEDPEALANCIRSFYRLPGDTRAQMGEAGRSYFSEEFEMNKQARRLVAILHDRKDAKEGGR